MVNILKNIIKNRAKDSHLFWQKLYYYSVKPFRSDVTCSYGDNKLTLIFVHTKMKGHL